mmetsp:Transcript_4685/g.8536  ORF Transcript_4685/g.8536 Transcript_4685/m.8536 type:complete len:247 (-) Transcript_4685:851-1591(-)
MAQTLALSSGKRSWNVQKMFLHSLTTTPCGRLSSAVFNPSASFTSYSAAFTVEIKRSQTLPGVDALMASSILTPSCSFKAMITCSWRWILRCWSNIMRCWPATKSCASANCDFTIASSADCTAICCWRLAEAAFCCMATALSLEFSIVSSWFSTSTAFKAATWVVRRSTACCKASCSVRLRSRYFCWATRFSSICSLLRVRRFFPSLVMPPLEDIRNDSSLLPRRSLSSIEVVVALVLVLVERVRG